MTHSWERGMAFVVDVAKPRIADILTALDDEAEVLAAEATQRAGVRSIVWE